MESPTAMLWRIGTVAPTETEALTRSEPSAFIMTTDQSPAWVGQVRTCWLSVPVLVAVQNVCAAGGLEGAPPATGT